MKNLVRILAVATLMANGFFGIAQTVTSGVYMTYEDYMNGEMEYAINCSEESHKIRPHGKLGSDKFEVVHRGEKFTHDRSEIFGYRDCDGKDWRLYGDSEYQIAETRSLIIYKQFDVKNSDPITGAIKPSYYFSVNNGDLAELTLMNLKETFPQEHDFHDKLDQAYSGDEDIASYDNYHKMYKVNRLLAITGN